MGKFQKRKFDNSFGSNFDQKTISKDSLTLQLDLWYYSENQKTME